MKNKTVQLVNEWAVFEEHHPQESIAGFCRYYLAQRDGTEARNPESEAAPELSLELMEVVSRIGKLNTLYAKLALKGTELSQVDEIGMLYTISQEKSPKKSEVVHASLLEFSSGIDMLNRMKRRGLIREVADREDKRSKRLMLTPKGEEALASCLRKIGKNAEMISAGLVRDEKKLVVHLLKDIALRFSSRWTKDRALSFEEIDQPGLRK